MTSPAAPHPLRWLRRLVLAIVALLLLGIIVAYFVVDFSGRAAWDRVQKELTAKGESLTVSGLVPPPVPDEQNFFADPLWAEFYDLVEEKGDDGKVTRTTRLPKGQRQLDVLTGSKVPSGKRTGSVLETGERPDLEFLAMEFRKRSPEAAEAGSAPEAILAGLSAADPILERLRTLSARPEARFPLDYSRGFQMDGLHWTVLLSTAQVLNQRILAEVAMGRGEEALADIVLLLKLADSPRSDPVLISLLISSSMIRIAVWGIWSGLDARVWDDEQIQEIQSMLGKTSVMAALPTALRFERAVVDELVVPAILRGGLKAFVGTLTPASQETSWQDRVWFETLSFVYPRGQLLRDLANYNLEIQRYIGDPSSLNGQDPPQPGAWDSLLSAVTRMALPAIRGAYRSALETEAVIRMGTIACALERYRMKNGAYPETLEALVPGQIDPLPSDPATGGGFLYKTTAFGFLMWSVGWDGRDDRGALRARRESPEGDWIWRTAAPLPPTPPPAP